MTYIDGGRQWPDASNASQVIFLVTTATVSNYSSGINSSSGSGPKDELSAALHGIVWATVQWTMFVVGTFGRPHRAVLAQIEDTGETIEDEYYALRRDCANAILL